MLVRSGKKGGKNGKAVKRATKKANGYYEKQKYRTEANRKRRQARHNRKHPNYIAGMERVTT